MPRKSAAELSLPPPLAISDQPHRRSGIAPPLGLPEPVRLRFVELVGSVDHEHFTAADVPLLTEYATACALARQAAHALQRDGPVTKKGRASPWLQVQEKAQRAMIALSTRLRLCPQGRINKRGSR